MLPIIGGIITAVGGIAKQWLQNRNEKAQAKHERQLKVISGDIELEKTTVEGMAKTWKDEYLTIVFTSPIVLIFYACLTENDRMLDNIFKAFNEMSKMPPEWWWTIGAITLGTFGLRGYNAWKGEK